MILESLEKFIETGEFTLEHTHSFKNEISNYINEIKSESSSVSVHGDFNGDFHFDRLKLISLLSHYLDGKVYEWDTEYMMSIIEFNYEGADEKIEEVLFNFSDPYLGYPITYDNVSNTIKYLIDDSKELCLESQKGIELRKGYRSYFLINSKIITE